MERRRSIEISFWVIGLSLLVAYVAVRAWSGYASIQGLAAMREARSIHMVAVNETHTQVAGRSHSPREFSPDTAAWSKARREAYQDSTTGSLMPLAVIQIPSLRLEVPVYAGASAAVLNRGAGWIEGTALPGADGNTGVAAHRDGFFRALKDIHTGDELYIETVERARRYRVTSIRIVAPQEVSVLDDTMQPSVTLVTCYPFYFVGAAPQRFIVRAEIAP